MMSIGSLTRNFHTISSKILSIPKTPNITRVLPEGGNLKKFWSYVAVAFNKVDEERLKLVGPNRLCAEWVLKNGGGVVLTEAPGKTLRDYNTLPPENIRFQIKEIDASNSSIMKIGLEHLKNCNRIDKIILHECKHLEEDSLGGLIHVKDTLKFLQVSGCYNISDEGLKPLKDLTNLLTLIIFDMPYVKNLSGIVSELSSALRNCKINQLNLEK